MNEYSFCSLDDLLKPVEVIKYQPSQIEWSLLKKETQELKLSLMDLEGVLRVNLKWSGLESFRVASLMIKTQGPLDVGFVQNRLKFSQGMVRRHRISDNKICTYLWGLWVAIPSANSTQISNGREDSSGIQSPRLLWAVSSFPALLPEHRLYPVTINGSGRGQGKEICTLLHPKLFNTHVQPTCNLLLENPEHFARTLEAHRPKSEPQRPLARS